MAQVADFLWVTTFTVMWRQNTNSSWMLRGQKTFEMHEAFEHTQFSLQSTGHEKAILSSFLWWPWFQCGTCCSTGQEAGTPHFWAKCHIQCWSQVFVSILPFFLKQKCCSTTNASVGITFNVSQHFSSTHEPISTKNLPRDKSEIFALCPICHQDRILCTSISSFHTWTSQKPGQTPFPTAFFPLFLSSLKKCEWFGKCTCFLLPWNLFPWQHTLSRTQHRTPRNTQWSP